MTPHDEEVGKLVQQARERRGVTQKELAAALGVDKRRITALENGHAYWDFARMVKTAEALRVPLRDLIPARLLGGGPPVNPELAAIQHTYESTGGDLREVASTVFDLVEARMRAGGGGGGGGDR